MAMLAVFDTYLSGGSAVFDSSFEDDEPSGAIIINGIPAAIVLDGITGSVISANPPRPEPYAKGALLPIVIGMAEGTWQKVNINSYSSAWPHADLRPLFASGNPTPEKIIGAWSGFAWDSNRGDLILYGGGHANYSGNDVYRWRARTLEWERAALSSEMTLVNNVGIAIDGADNAPASAHTYDNAVFLPIADRYLNFGGAIYNTGGPYQKPDENNPETLRNTGPYLFDPEKSDPWKVGGTTGSHVQRVAPYPEVVGGQMWENRDFYKNVGSHANNFRHINGCTSYSPEEDNYDVVYFGARVGGGTNMHLYKYELKNIGDPSQDVVTQVGRHWVGPTTQTAGAYDPVRKVFLRLGSNANRLYFWDLTTGGSPTNDNQLIAMTGGMVDLDDWLTDFNTTHGTAIGWMGLEYDPIRGNFILWSGLGEIWRITPPTPLATTGWVAEQETDNPSVHPTKPLTTGVLGKWRYAPGYDVFVGLQDIVEGEVWVYKPVGWEAPPVTKGINIPLHNGSTPVGAQSNVQVAFFDQPEPGDFNAPALKTKTASINDQGELIVELSGTSLELGQPGFAIVYKLDTNNHEDSPVFAGQVVVTDVS